MNINKFLTYATYSLLIGMGILSISEIVYAFSNEENAFKNYYKIRSIATVFIVAGTFPILVKLVQMLIDTFKEDY